MRWAIRRNMKRDRRFMSEPGTGAWTDKLENVYWFDDEEAAHFRSVLRVWTVVTEEDVLAILVAREFTPED